jgi:FkbM family methyltransferase
MKEQVNTETNKDELIKLANQIGGIQVIYDIGSRDALDGIELFQRILGNELHVFECNPPSAKVCRKNLDKHLGNEVKIKLNEVAVSDKEGEITFHPIDTEKTITAHADGNPGASSIFIADPQYPKEKYVQNSIVVKTTSLNKYCEINTIPDLLWLDVQGAELMVLKGSEKILKSVKIINLEVGFKRTYLNQPLYFEINDFLVSKGFRLHHLDTGRWPKWIWLFKVFKTGPWVCNAIFVNENIEPLNANVQQEKKALKI